MKKLITICVLIVTVFTVNAQQKPTKKETIAYLDKILKMSIGYKTYGLSEEDKRAEEYQIIDYTFSEFKVENTVIEINYKKNSSVKDEQAYSNIIWANNTAIEIGKRDTSLYRDNEIVSISLQFSNKLLVDRNYTRDNPGDEMRFQNWLSFVVLKTKSESFKKALERLVEIAKEENKNPFED